MTPEMCLAMFAEVFNSSKPEQGDQQKHPQVSGHAKAVEFSTLHNWLDQNTRDEPWSPYRCPEKGAVEMKAPKAKL